MATIQSTGLGSGLEINNIVESLVAAEKDPQISKIEREAQKAVDQISALGVLNNALSEVKSSYSSLAKVSSYNSTASSSADSSIITATTGFGAAAGTYELEVQNLAQSHTVITSAYTTVNDVIGEGTLTIRFGDYDDDTGAFALNADKTIQTITVDSTNNTLTTLADHINESDYGVKASIVNDGSGYRLVLQSAESGDKNSLEITAADNDGDDIDNTGLSSLVYTETNKNLTQTQAGEDARIIMDGITITRESNTVSEVVQGVTFNLINAEPGKKVKVTVSQDTSEIESNIRGFVDTYNAVMAQIADLTKFNSSNGEKGVLIGDASVRGIQSMLRDILNTQLSDIDGSIKSIADLGIVTQRDGTLEINEDSTTGLAVFSDVMANNVEDIAKFFAASGNATDSQVQYISRNSLTQPGTYDLEVTQLATQSVLTGNANLPDLSVGSVTIDNTSDTFKVRVDGILSNDIVLESKTYNTEAELISEIQSKINSDSTLNSKGISVQVGISANALTITSNTYGSTSAVAITEAEAAMDGLIGLTVSQGTTGLNAAGTIDGIAALGDGQFLLSETGNSSGLKIQVSGGALGSRGSVTFSEGLTAKMTTILDGLIDNSISSNSGDLDVSSGTIDAKTDSLYKKLKELDKQEEDLNYKMDLYEARLFKTFNAMDLLVNQLNGTSSALQNSLDALPGYTRESN